MSRSTPAPPTFGLSRRDETGDSSLVWHCAVAPRGDGRWSGRMALVASGWTIGTSLADRRVCRLAAGDERAAIDANIASAGVDHDVDAALLAPLHRRARQRPVPRHTSDGAAPALNQRSRQR